MFYDDRLFVHTHHSLWSTLLHAVFYLARSSTLNMETTHSFGKYLDLQQTVRRCISEDRSLHRHSSDNLKFDKRIDMFYAEVWSRKQIIRPKGSIVLTTRHPLYHEFS
jgi:hypothetical protein